MRRCRTPRGLAEDRVRVVFVPRIAVRSAMRLAWAPSRPGMPMRVTRNGPACRGAKRARLLSGARLSSSARDWPEPPRQSLPSAPIAMSCPQSTLSSR